MIHDRRPVRTLTPDEWTAKTWEFALENNVLYQPGDTMADIIERIFAAAQEVEKRCRGTS